MDVIGRACGRWRRIQALLMSACFAASYAHAQRVDTERPGWQIERGVAMPRYAVIEPTASNLNIDVVVLGCEQAGKGNVLQLQLYLSAGGRLRPLGATPPELTDDPQGRISIDNAEYPVEVVFAGDHVLLADGTQGRFPRLSDRLIEAMQTGRTMILHFTLPAPGPDHPASFDGNATVDLQAAGASRAFAAMRQCANPGTSAARY